jgi:hypothetical protein
VSVPLARSEILAVGSRVCAVHKRVCPCVWLGESIACVRPSRGWQECMGMWSNYNATCYYSDLPLPLPVLLPGASNVFGVLLGNGMYNVPSVPGRYTKFVSQSPFGPRALRLSGG